MQIAKYLRPDKSDCLSLYNSNAGEPWHSDLLNEFEKFVDSTATEIHRSTAKLNGKIVGFLGHRAFIEFIWIEWLVISKPSQRLGIGKTLVENLLNSANKKTVRVGTAARTLEFYKKCGFEIESIEKSAYPGGADKIRMKYNGCHQNNSGSIRSAA